MKLKTLALLASLCVAATPAANDEIPAADPPLSAAAARALDRHEEALDDAWAAYQRAAESAERTLLRDLDAALQSAMKDADLQEALRIETAKAAAEARLAYVTKDEQRKRYAVRADRGWQNVVRVRRGQTITIEATGTTVIDSHYPDRKFPPSGLPIGNTVAGYLQARVEQGPPIRVNEHASFVADRDGVLQLSINDPGGIADNSGALRVRVGIDKPEAD